MTVDLDRVERRFGARDAFVSPSGTTTYVQLAERVRDRAAEVGGHGVAPGDRVALICGEKLEAIVSMLALHERGCPLMPLGAPTRPRERERLARVFGARWLLDGPVPSSVPSTPGGASGGPAAAPADGLAVAIPSSGSTGAPKLILNTVEQLRARTDHVVRATAIEPVDRVLALVPFEHGFGQTLFRAVLSAGACLVLPASPHPRSIVQTIADQAVTLAPGPASLFDLMVRHRREGWASLAGLRAAMSAASPLSLETHRAFTQAMGVPLWQSYGASECGGICLNQSGTSHAGELAVGTPYPDVEVAILDGAGRELPDGETGEVVVRSPGVAQCYEGDDDGSSRIAGGRFFTGDLGTRRDGNFFFRGRRKLMIETAGRKVNPIEVERTLRGHPDVDDAVVMAHAASGREIVRAIVVARSPVGAETLMEFCGRELADYKVPRIIEFRESLPRDDLGKLARGQL